MADQQMEDLTPEQGGDEEMETNHAASERDGQKFSEVPKNEAGIDEEDLMKKGSESSTPMDFEQSCEHVQFDPFDGVNIADLLSTAEVAAVYSKTVQNHSVKQVFRSRLMLMGCDGEAKTNVKMSLTGKRCVPGDDARRHTERQVETIHATDKEWRPIRKEDVAKELSDEDRRDLAAEFSKELYKYRVKQLNDMASHQRHEANVIEDTPAGKSDWSTKVESGISSDPEMIRLVEEEIEQIRQAGGIKGVGHNKKAVTLDLWDFPAHEIFNNTHKVFFTRLAVYLYVYDLSKELGVHGEPGDNIVGQQESKSNGGDQKTPHDDLERFLSSIVAHTRQCDQDKRNSYAPVFIIITHPEGLAGKDELISTGSEKIQLISKEKPTDLNIMLYPIGNDPNEVEKLHRFIFEVISEDKQSRQEVPLRSTQLEETITEGKFNHILRKPEFKQLAAPHFVENDFRDSLQFLHDLGKILLFDDLRHDSTLKDIIITDPQWLISQVERIVDLVEDKNMVARYKQLSNGILKLEVIKSVWSNLTLLDFMVDYCVFFGHYPRPKFYYVPALLPSRDDLEKEESLQRCSSVFYCLPLNVDQFHQLSVLSLVYIDQAEISYSQIIFPQEENHRAVITFDKTSYELKVCVQNADSGDQTRPWRPVRRIVNEVFQKICHAIQKIQETPSCRGQRGPCNTVSIECREPGCHLRIPLPSSVRSLQDSQSPGYEYIPCDHFHQNNQQNSIADMRVMFGARRDITISICTSAQEGNVKGLINFLTKLKVEKPFLRIKDVHFHLLPYNDLDDYKLSPSKPVDVMILCHSIYNRRFAITDVLDSLYNEFLPHCNRVLGKGRIALLVHDFSDTNDEEDANRIKSFRSRQPTAFQTTGLTCTCGHLGEEFSMKQSRQEDLIRFLEEASTVEEGMKADSMISLHGIKQKVSSTSTKFKNFLFGNDGGSSVDGDRCSMINANRHGRTTSSSFSGQDERKRRLVETGATKHIDDGEQGAFKHVPHSVSSEHKSHQLHGLSIADLKQVKNTNAGSSEGKKQCTSREATKQKAERVSITIYSLSTKEAVNCLVQYLVFQTPERGIQRDVQFHQLKEGDLFGFQPVPTNGLIILCHSVKGSEYALTDDLYGTFLQKCESNIGTRRIAIIVHDIDIGPGKNVEYISHLRRQRSTAFTMSHLVIACGKLSPEVKMEPEDFTQLNAFISQADLAPGQVVFGTAHSSVVHGTVPGSEQNQNYLAQTQGGSQPSSNTSVVPVTNTNRSVQNTYSPTTHAHPVSVIICTSAREDNVIGLKHELEKLKGQSQELIADVRIQELPYNDIDNFKFPDVQQNDVMVLCHSINNRGFLITDVMNALYDKYLHHCNKVFGKNRIAVVVHDFKDTSSSATEARITSFQQRQPTTFQLAGLVITLEKLTVEATIPEMEWAKLIDFLQKARREPPAVKQEPLLKTGYHKVFSTIESFFS